MLATTKSTPFNCFSIMLLTAFPPAPPTPKTVIRGFNSSFSDTDKFNVILDPPVLPNFFGAKFTAIIKLYNTAFC